MDFHGTGTQTMTKAQFAEIIRSAAECIVAPRSYRVIAAEQLRNLARDIESGSVVVR